MSLPTRHNTSAYELVNAGSLEVLRAQTTKNIQKNIELSSKQKEKAIQELNFLVDAERARRQRQLAFQWNEERREYVFKQALRYQEVESQLKLSRARTARAVARLNRDAARCKLEIIVAIRKLRPRENSDSRIHRAKDEIYKLQLQETLARRREAALGHRLEQQVLRRAAFMKKVRKHSPDLEDELVDHYDQLQFQNASHKGRSR